MSGTTSGTYSYNQQVVTIVTGSLRLCGAIQENETPDASMLRDCMDALNALIKGWSVAQIHVWCEAECILFLQPLQNQYKLGTGSIDNACLFQDLTQTTLTATATMGATVLSVASSTGMLVGDNFGVQLDLGVIYWTTLTAVSTGSVTLAYGVPSQATSGAICFDYTTKLVRPLRVPEGRRYLYSTQIETPLIALSRFDYDYLPNKYNTGTVTQFFYDPQQGRGAYSTPIGLMNVWPTPSDDTAGVRFVAQHAIQDVTSLTNDVDFPVEWLAPLRWNLAVEIAPEFDVPGDRFDRLKAKADEWFLRVSAWDREPESVFFGYASQPGYR